MTDSISPDLRHALLHDPGISRCNKWHIAAGLRSRGFDVEAEWAGIRHRMRVRIGDEPWREVPCFELDVLPEMDLKVMGRPG